MFALCVIAFLCLMPVSHSAPLACDNTVRLLDQLDLHHLEGRWALIAVSLNNSAELEKFKSRESASINFVNASETSTVSLMRAFHLNGSCQYMQSNITLEGSGFTFSGFNISVAVLFTSCPDCLVMRFDNESKKPVRVHLFSRRREVEQKEMEEFRAQAECLNMFPPAVMDPTKELCPEQISTHTAAQTEEETEGQNAWQTLAHDIWSHRVNQLQMNY